MPRRKTKKPSAARKNVRASWKGNLTFGLVSFTVEAFNALDRSQSDIHFHQIHAECHRRIHYQKVCPLHGEVSNEEIVSGYEVSKGRYIEIDPDELDALRTARERALTIDAFIAPDSIDPLYFDGRMYYLLPAGAAAEDPYAVIVKAMDREQCYGVGQVVFSGKDQIVLLRPVEGVLHMAMLNYEAEIRPVDKVAQALPKSVPQARQLKLAQTLIRDWSVEDFDFGKYTDTYRERVEELIEAKSKGRKLPEPEDEEEPETINLMEALKRSLGQSTKPGRHKAAKKTPRKKRSA
jgi:DNA end-binding protein Ku